MRPLKKEVELPLLEREFGTLTPDRLLRRVIGELRVLLLVAGGYWLRGFERRGDSCFADLVKVDEL